jgi:hypothetical protein
MVSWRNGTEPSARFVSVPTHYKTEVTVTAAPLVAHCFSQLMPELLGRTNYCNVSFLALGAAKNEPDATELSRPLRRHDGESVQLTARGSSSVGMSQRLEGG